MVMFKQVIRKHYTIRRVLVLRARTESLLFDPTKDAVILGNVIAVVVVLLGMSLKLVKRIVMLVSVALGCRWWRCVIGECN